MGDKTLTATNDVLAAPDQMAQIHGKHGCLHEMRELDFTEAIKIDGCRPSLPITTASGHAVGYLGEVSERSASTSHLTDNKEGGQACWKVGQEQAGLL